MRSAKKVQFRLPPGHSEIDFLEALAVKVQRPITDLDASAYRIVRKSVDARRKSAIAIQYTVELDYPKQPLAGIGILLTGDQLSRSFARPVVVGAGPAGLFAALYLARAGKNPLLIERGLPVEKRSRDVSAFWQTGRLELESNVQFGEGGAGTFSDGKLTSGINNHYSRAVLQELVLAGAPAEILFLAKPHIGTDRLRLVVKALRERIISLGGEIWFGSRLTGLVSRAGAVAGLQISRLIEDGSAKDFELAAGQVILAVGHSARDTYEMLFHQNIFMSAKPFSLGLRIEHDQVSINTIQYGQSADHSLLPPAEYKLACHLPGGRSVYTFCMCPGGQVIASASEENGLVVNGMSYFARSGSNSNSALLVNVVPDDFPTAGPLAGMYWQRQLEQNAFQAGGGSYFAPIQRLDDFLGRNHGIEAWNRQGKKDSCSPQPTYQPGTRWTDCRSFLPDLVSSALQQALPLLNQRMPGFADPRAVLTGIETRSSAPLRINRGQDLQSSLQGLYPCGEGAGYAGGIMSAAIDGLKCAQALCRG